MKKILCVMMLVAATFGGGCLLENGEIVEETTDATPMNMAPTAEITAPTSGTTFTVGDDISVTVKATDDDGNVIKVDFYRNEGNNPDFWIAKIEGEHADGIYQTTWEDVPAGTYVLHAVAADNDGALGDSQDVTIVVKPRDAGLPDFTVTAGQASVNPGQCTQVMLDIRSDVTSCLSFGGNADWAGLTVTTDTTRNVCPTGTGTTYGWRCIGPGGTRDQSVTVNVNAVGSPTVTLSSNGTSFVSPATIELDAAVNYGGTINRVEFRDGTSVLCTDSVAPYHCTWTNAGIGAHQVTAVAYPTSGNSATSNELTISVYQSSSEVPCHGLGLYFSNAQVTNITRCTKWSKTGSGTEITKSTFVDGGVGACAITCYDNTGNTVLPQAVTGVWVQNGTSDTTRWYTTGCARLPWHPAAEPDQAGGAWDKLCDRTVTSLSGPPTP